jgi:4a-hydroxytetrahydrobiopterin dehydratase
MAMTLEELLHTHCQAYGKGEGLLSDAEIEELMVLIPGWERVENGKTIRRSLRFEGFTDAADFIAKLPPIANSEDHHPDLRLYRYRWVDVDFTTHSAGGLTLNDFIMAAKVNKLYGG